MSWIQPMSQLFAGIATQRPMAVLVHRLTSRLRLIAEAFGTTLVVIGRVWLVKQRR
jgi:hypothetical protein